MGTRQDYDDAIDWEIGRRVVAAVSGIGMEPFDGAADELFDRRDDASQRVAVIGIAGLALAHGRRTGRPCCAQGGGNADLETWMLTPPTFVRASVAARPAPLQECSTRSTVSRPFSLCKKADLRVCSS